MARTRPDTITAGERYANVALKVASGATAGAYIGSRVSSHNYQNSKLGRLTVDLAYKTKNLSQDRNAPKHVRKEAGKLAYKSFKQHQSLNRLHRIDGAKTGGVGGLLFTAALEANNQWGRYLDKPQKVSRSEVSGYIDEAIRKGIYKPRKKRKDILDK